MLQESLGRLILASVNVERFQEELANEILTRRLSERKQRAPGQHTFVRAKKLAVNFERSQRVQQFVQEKKK